MDTDAEGDGMTEAEWLACGDHYALLLAIGELARVPARKLRLFGVACWYRCLSDTADAETAKLIELFVRYEDGLLPPGEWLDEFTAAGRAVRSQAFKLLTSTNPLTAAAQLSQYAKADAALVALRNADDHIRALADATAREQAAKVGLVRDIFGNPFAPPHFDPNWRTDTAVALARQMYDAREFSAAPILADALQDAGCDSDELLAHLRDSAQGHARGCWAIDLVLGRE